MRDRLIELLKGTPDLWMPDLASEMIADHLLANGVTVQEWVSVKDRLPEETQGFLVVLNNEDVDVRVFNSKNEPYQTYSSMLDKFLFCDDKGEWHTTDRVTHWMPPPQPPKGE